MSYQKQIKVVVGDLIVFTEKLIKAISLNVTANLRIDNPYDTGWSRANWINSIGKRTLTPVGSKQNVDDKAQEASIAHVATSYTLEQGIVFISNSVRYIVALNSGSSKQAPAGFVQIAIVKGVDQTVKSVK